jgi:hypothetical protein
MSRQQVTYAVIDTPKLIKVDTSHYSASLCAGEASARCSQHASPTLSSSCRADMAPTAPHGTTCCHVTPTYSTRHIWHSAWSSNRGKAYQQCRHQGRGKGKECVEQRWMQVQKPAQQGHGQKSGWRSHKWSRHAHLIPHALRLRHTALLHRYEQGGGEDTRPGASHLPTILTGSRELFPRPDKVGTKCAAKSFRAIRLKL